MSASRLRRQGTDPRIGDRVRPPLRASVTVPDPKRFRRSRTTEVEVILEDMSVSGVGFRSTPLPVGAGAVVPMRVGPCDVMVRIHWERPAGDGMVRYGAELVKAPQDYLNLVTIAQATSGREVPLHPPTQ